MKPSKALPFGVRLMHAAASWLFGAAVLLALVALLRWAANLDAFAIREVHISGDLKHYNAINLRTTVLPQLHGTFFSLDLKAAQQAFEAIPWVRKAVVHRVFPNHLQVHLEEHQAIALWGPEDSSGMVNSFGEVFDANIGEVEPDDLVRLNGATGQAPQLLVTYRLLQPIFANLNFKINQLDLSPRGSWKISLDNGTNIELGHGDANELVARSKRFLATVERATKQYQRQPEQVLTADLRYPDGYAMQLAGISTATNHSGKQQVTNSR